MEQSKALQGLMEAADLVRMLEDLTHPTVLSSISAASMAGVRVTLKNVRESILTSHDALAAHVIQRAKVQIDAAAPGVHSLNGNNLAPEKNESAPAESAISRRSLRSSLERMIEKSS